MLQYFGLVNNGSSFVCGSAGLIIPTRSDYGGRLSLLTLHLPLLVLVSMLTILWMFHSSFYGSWVNIYWLVAGFILMLSEWYRVGMWESRFQATTSFKINTLGSFIFLVCFESAFFAGTYWLMCISRVHGLGDVSFRSNLSGSDVALYGSWECSEWSFNVSALDTIGTIYMSSDYSFDCMGEIILPIMLNLWILLLVSLLLQLGHRTIQVADL